MLIVTVDNKRNLVNISSTQLTEIYVNYNCWP